MRIYKKLHLALNGLSSGFQHIDSRDVQCGSEHAFRLPMGKCSGDIEKRLDTLVAAVGAPVELIDRGGAVVLRVVERDFPKELDFNPKHLQDDQLLIGYDRLLNPKQINLMHTLIGGAAGGGKTMLIRFLLYQLIRMDAIIKIIDLKGYSFFPFEAFPNVSVARDIEEAADTMNEAATEIERRMNLIVGQRNRSLTLTLPLYVVWIDEAGQIAPSTYPKGKLKALAAYCDDTCGRIAQIGRESRVLLFYCTQKPSADIVNGQVKANVESRIAFRTNNHYESGIILGDEGAERISPATPGRCIYKYDRKYNIQVPFIGEDDDDWVKLLAPMKPEVITLGKSRRSEPQRISVDGSFKSADRHDKAVSNAEPITRPAKESIVNPPAARKGKVNHKPASRTGKDMVSHPKRETVNASYTDEIAD